MTFALTSQQRLKNSMCFIVHRATTIEQFLNPRDYIGFLSFDYSTFHTTFAVARRSCLIKEERLAKEREARIRAERRVRELETRLKEAERRLQWTSSSSSSSQDQAKKTSSPPTVASPNEPPRPIQFVSAPLTTTELEIEDIDETPCPSTPEEDVTSRPSATSRSRNLPNTFSSTPTTPITTPTPNTTSPRRRISSPTSPPSVVYLERSSDQLPRHGLEMSDSLEEAVQLLESTWRQSQGPPDGAPGEMKEENEKMELDAEIPSPENRGKTFFSPCPLILYFRMSFTLIKKYII
ncbi:hypothetical protein ACTXT7_015000 [Hymenolepis weldensis]